MKRVPRVVSLLLCLLLVCSLAGCGSSAKLQIRSTLKSFESACQEVDLNELLDCIDPTIAQPFRTGASLVGTLTGQTSEEVLDAIVPLLFGSDYTSSDFLQSLSLKVEDIAVAQSSATALCTLSFTVDGETVDQETSVDLILVSDDEEGDTWYISSLTFQ